jgi:Lon protease-like protein
MAWFNPARPPPEVTTETLNIPLFPLNTVLFHGSLLPLKIFEQRYLDMAAVCMKDDQPFGICLIASGKEAGPVAQPHAIGTLARITQWDMAQLGILTITALGAERFQIIQSHPTDNLLEAEVKTIADTGPTPFPPERNRLLPFLQRIINDLGPERIATPHRFDEAEWVSYRITEILPIQNLAKQKLLELDDAVMRLEILEKFLDQRQLLD